MGLRIRVNIEWSGVLYLGVHWGSAAEGNIPWLPFPSRPEASQVIRWLDEGRGASGRDEEALNAGLHQLHMHNIWYRAAAGLVSGLWTSNLVMRLSRLALYSLVLPCCPSCPLFFLHGINCCLVLSFLLSLCPYSLLLRLALFWCSCYLLSPLCSSNPYLCFSFLLYFPLSYFVLPYHSYCPASLLCSVMSVFSFPLFL